MDPATVLVTAAGDMAGEDTAEDTAAADSAAVVSLEAGELAGLGVVAAVLVVRAPAAARLQQEGAVGQAEEACRAVPERDMEDRG
jgi:hypothetical protein